MKHRYIESLQSEIQLLASRVENLKENKKASFSFLKESFKHTQEIARLLHELEFVQIEEMKERMENLVQFLSDAESYKNEPSQVPIVAVVEPDKTEVNSNREEQIVSEVDDVAKETESKEVVLAKTKQEDSLVVDAEDEEKTLFPDSSTVEVPEVPVKEIVSRPSLPNNQSNTVLSNLAPKGKSLNDVQPVNQTIQDVKRSISLNDRFLFQRELFDNNRDAMNAMLTKLQSFSSLDLAESYLERNTDWDFNDETVDKFLQMLKDSFK